MAVSIADMERFAIGGDGPGDDLGNVIELGDFGSDGLGLDLLTNSSKMGGNSGRTVNIGPSMSSSSSSMFNGGGDDLGGIDVSPLEPLEPIKINSFDTGPQIDLGNLGGPPPEINFVKENNTTSNSFGGGLFSNNQTSTGGGIHLAASRDPEQDKKEKSDYINKLQRLEQKGFPVARKYTMDNSLQEIKDEYNRLVDARNLETSIKFQRQMLMGAITGLEWLNGRFDPFDLKLDGWSESVHENVEDFDEIFEELYDKYKDRGKMSPEMRLVMAIGGSGFMCHVSNSFFRSKMPSMDNVLRSNPELARQMAAAAAQQAGPGFGNFMGMAMGANMPGNGGPPPVGPTPSSMADTGGFFNAPNAPPSAIPTPAPTTVRREMNGPSGVEDILKTFEEVRRAEMTSSSFTEPATGFATQPAVAGVVSGTASVFTAEDAMSQGTSATTNRRNRRRAQAAPVGNTLSLNV